MSAIINGLIQEGDQMYKLPHGIEYYKQRQIFIDCRGTLQIAESAMFGYNIFIYTQSHDINDLSKVVDRPVIIKAKSFIGSNSVIYNSSIGEGAIVSVGSVLRSQNVPNWTMVAGNPAVRIASFRHDIKKWIYDRFPIELVKRG